MDKHFIVCKYQTKYLKALADKSVVFYIDSLSKLPALVKDCSENRIHIHCVVYKTKKSLSDIIFSEDWIKVPIAIETPSIGKLSNFLKMGVIIKKLNIRFFFSTVYKGCYKDIRILASLGYACTLNIAGASADWDALAELMTYAILNPVGHAEIYPFEYVCSSYDPQRKTDYSAVYFRDPERYLHLTREGKLSLPPSGQDSENGFTIDMSEYNSISEKKEFIENRYKWQDFFLQSTECSCCKGWRICLGKFADFTKTNPGCSDFFGEFLDVLDAQNDNAKEAVPKAEIWQP